MQRRGHQRDRGGCSVITAEGEARYLEVLGSR